MARRRKGRNVDGIVLVDKPIGLSSNTVLQRVRAIYGASKAGHTGALDPLATGMLPVCLGEATKFSQFLLDSDKVYTVTAQFGERTDTSDADGEVIERKDVNITEQDITRCMVPLTGDIKQVPTMFSALKHQGKPLYFYARQGITVERPARPITIYQFDLLSFDDTLSQASFRVHCSKGTYIRTLIDDLGQALGCGAHVAVLRRERVASYPTERMVTMEQLQSFKDDNKDDQGAVDYTQLDSQLLQMDTAVEKLPALNLASEHIQRLRFGQTLPSDPSTSDGLYRTYDDSNKEFVGVIQVSQGVIAVQRLVVLAQ